MEYSNTVLKLKDRLCSCNLCPNNCMVDRTSGGQGLCGIDDTLRVASTQLHFGEESVLVGKYGSGTIFFSGCNLKCVYCQNYDISWEHRGMDMKVSDLAEVMLKLQFQKAANINLVTPTHQIVPVLEAIEQAKKKWSHAACRL
jgi:putative pyruvate formate lyase activating enzyme